MMLNIEKAIEAVESERKTKTCTFNLPVIPTSEDIEVFDIGNRHLNSIIHKVAKEYKVDGVSGGVDNIFSPFNSHYLRYFHHSHLNDQFYVVGYDIIKDKYKRGEIVTALRFTEKTDIPKLMGLIKDYFKDHKEKK